MSTRVCYTFDDFRLDVQTRVLYKKGELVALEPRVVDMLMLLVEHCQSIVSKEQLLAGVWGKVIVEEGVIRRNISLMRSALDPHSPERYIKTYKGIGYSFVGPLSVETVDDIDDHAAMRVEPIAAASSPQGSSRRWRLTSLMSQHRWLLSLAVMIAALLLLVPLALDMAHPKFSARQITSNSSQQLLTAAAISPDGNLLAFADENGLYISDAGTVERYTRPLLRDAIATYIEWYADGMHLLVSGVRPGTGEQLVWKMSALGGEPQLLFQDARMASPSPDNKHLLFVRGDNQLWIVEGSSMQSRLLHLCAAGDTITARPRFSFDSRYVVLASTAADSSITVVNAIDIRSGTMTQLYSTDDSISDLLMLDDRTLLMARNSSTSEPGLVSMKVNLQGGGHSRTHAVAKSMDQSVRIISATRDRGTLLVLDGRANSSVYIADLSEEGSQLNNARRFTMDDYANRPGTWLADNRTLVYYSSRGGHFNLFSRALDEAEARPLVLDEGEKSLPVITADQRWMFYFVHTSGQRRYDADLALVRYSMSDGKTTTIDTRPDAYRMLRCATQANRCVIMEHTRNEGTYYEFDPLAGRGRRLAAVRWSPGKTYTGWDISPDGSQIGFIDSVNDPAGIGIIAIDESPVRVFMLHVNGTSPLRTLHWDALGKGFYVSAFDGAGDLLQLWHVERNGKTDLLRWQTGSDDGRAMPSPDGKHLAFQQDVIKSNIWLLQRE